MASDGIKKRNTIHEVFITINHLKSSNFLFLIRLSTCRCKSEFLLVAIWILVLFLTILSGFI